MLCIKSIIPVIEMTAIGPLQPGLSDNTGEEINNNTKRAKFQKSQSTGSIFYDSEDNRTVHIDSNGHCYIHLEEFTLQHEVGNSVIKFIIIFALNLLMRYYFWISALD